VFLAVAVARVFFEHALPVYAFEVYIPAVQKEVAMEADIDHDYYPHCKFAPNGLGWLVALHCTALHCTALHCTALHCTALH
jgi:hypothetical protein